VFRALLKPWKFTGMAAEIRVLIVDDSSLVQEVLRSIFQSASGLEVAGVAGNGREAVELTAKLRPDVIVMDINMPELDGLEATQKIMAYYPTPILILTSMDGAEIAFQALSNGALEVMEKPELDAEKCRALIRKIKLSAGVQVATHIAGRRGGEEHAETIYRQQPAPKKPVEPALPRPSATSDVRPRRVVGIGSSTGGPNALGQIFSALPIDFPASILVVQHIADGFVPVLVNWLNGTSPIRVKEAEDTERLAPGTAYIAPNGLHMELVGDRISLNAAPPLAGHRPSADVLLSSLARYCGERGMGVILSGMGRDGARGVKEIRNAGGYTVAQSEETCVVFGMPGAAVELDGVNRVLTPQGIADAMLQQVQEGKRS
jgi:two-component system, chemotaxis family, protein-glutamate methylesterase/glutaminase